jgi:hypothetical protein
MNTARSETKAEKTPPSRRKKSKHKIAEAEGRLAPEPLLHTNPHHFVLFPIQHPNIWQMYKKDEASFWTTRKINLSRDKAGKLPDDIKKRLCWLGDSFRMYLRDTAIIKHQHVDALLAALQEVMDLIAALPKEVIALSTMMEGTDDPDMHKYADEMD